MTEFGFSQKTLEVIKAHIMANPNIAEAKIFGSRALGKHRKYSDIDIALFGSICTKDAHRLKNSLEESIVYYVDALVYDELSNAELREHIDTYGVNIV